MPLPNHDLSDCSRVKKQADEDAPIPFDGNDSDGTPYDPNDDDAVEHFLTEATRVFSDETGKQKGIRKAS